jgi:peptidyl-tRNA hydrolase
MKMKKIESYDSNFSLKTSYYDTTKLEKEIKSKDIEKNKKYMEYINSLDEEKKKNLMTPKPLNLEAEINKIVKYKEVDINLMMPQTFMNLSGKSLSLFLRINLDFIVRPNENRLLLIVDDILLNFGVFILEKGTNVSSSDLGFYISFIL